MGHEPGRTAKETLLSRFVKEAVHDLDNYYCFMVRWRLYTNPKAVGLLRKSCRSILRAQLFEFGKDYVSMNQADLSIILRDLLYPALKAS